MGEAAAVAAAGEAPVTAASLAGDLRALGLPSGATVLVHSSLRSLGWVCGGAEAVIDGVLRAVGPSGTMVVPTHTANLSEPSRWRHPPVPEAWWPVIRDETPPYRPDRTPARGMGAVPECFRPMAGVRRGPHPQLSFAAYGPRAEEVVDPHPPEAGLGEGSPLARLEAAGAWTLLLGCGHDVNTSLHLAEYRADWPGKRLVREGAPILVDGVRRWVTWEDVDLDADDFARLGAALEAETDVVLIGRVGQATARLMPIGEAVGFAVGWLVEHRR